MPNYNPSLQIAIETDPTTFYTMCPYNGLPCRKEQCISAILVRTGGQWFFTGCELQENIAKIKMYEGQLNTIITAIHDTSSMVFSEFGQTQAIIDSDATSIMEKIQFHIDENNEDFDRVYNKLEETRLMQLEKFLRLISQFDFENTLANHRHLQHNHPLAHHASVKAETPGSMYIPIIQPALYLLQEWTSGTDVDGDGRIYGRHFKISSRDPYKPMILKGIEKVPDWKNPPPIPGSRITYAQYVQQVHWGGEV